MTEFIKTTPQAKAGKKPNWRCGAPAGNQNAAKPVPTLSRKVRALKRRIRAALKNVP
jgi:hypothetical protein